MCELLHWGKKMQIINNRIPQMTYMIIWKLFTPLIITTRPLWMSFWERTTVVDRKEVYCVLTLVTMDLSSEWLLEFGEVSIQSWNLIFPSRSYRDMPRNFEGIALHPLLDAAAYRRLQNSGFIIFFTPIQNLKTSIQKQRSSAPFLLKQF